MDRILLIDDNREFCIQVKKTLALHNFDLEFYTDGKVGLEKALNESWGLMLLDVFLYQSLNGMDILEEIVKIKPQTPIIMISAESTLQTAVEATKTGAYDFLEKPLNVDRLLIVVKRAIEKNKLFIYNQNLLKEINKDFQLIGNSNAIRKIMIDIEQAAAADVKVLVQGESGTGKDLIAKIIHYKSKRDPNRFVSINCATIPHNLFETELFGYEEGAFTGANKTTDGKIFMAEDGTLFLDEIAELPFESQAKFLKFLQDGQYHRVGGNTVIHSNARIIAATNKNIVEEIKADRFRADLFYRLNVLNIVIPPLRKRPEDIPPLADYFLYHVAKELDKNITHFSDKAMELICEELWQGNARQLKSAIYRMVLFATSNIIDYRTAATAIQMDHSKDMKINQKNYSEAARAFERQYFLEQLILYRWDILAVAQATGLSEEQIKEKIAILKLDEVLAEEVNDLNSAQ